jgi:Ni,Fe-hydrogenase III small subunit
MFRLLKKVFSTPKTVKSTAVFRRDEEFEALGERLSAEIRRLFRGSLAIREVDAGSTNAEEQEITALSNAFYDIERFGVRFVASPRHADMLFVTGPVSRNMAEALRRTYDATPSPKLVVAVGDDAIDGGIFKDSYAVLDGVEKVIPVDWKIPGDPPSPKTIISHLLRMFEKMDK